MISPKEFHLHLGDPRLLVKAGAGYDAANMIELFHLVGIAGTGMSALAELLLGLGYRVSGSDRLQDGGTTTEILSKLLDRGIRLYPQDGSGCAIDPDSIVVSSAIESGNPDLVAAEERGIPILHRTELLARLSRDKRIIAVAGTAGKSTVTAMVGWILEQAGWDPTVVNGAPIIGWDKENSTGSVRVGKSDWWIIEADESDKSLLHFQPEYACITNISADHFDMEESIELFQKFVSQVEISVVCGETLTGILSSAFRENGHPTIIDPRRLQEYGIILPGRYNQENAHIAYNLCREAGCPEDVLMGALAGFPGVRRRLECVGEVDGIRVIDDYAHNPEKIRAAWQAASEMGRRVLGVWRPHGFTPLATMQEPLGKVLDAVMHDEDSLFVLPVYYAGGTVERTISSLDFVRGLQQRGLSAYHTPSYEFLADQLANKVQRGDVVLVMGARDPALSCFAGTLMDHLNISREKPRHERR